MTKFWPPKDPDEVLDYDIDWTDRLDDGDTVNGSIWSITGDDADLTTNLDSFTDTMTKIWLEAGTLGEMYILTNRIETAAGRVMDQSVRLRIKSK